MTDRVGFAGTGLMGRGMAKNILAAGYPLAVVAHRSREPIEALVRLGATEIHSYRELAAGSDVVVLCVTGTPEVESVVYRPDGLLEGAHEGLIVVDCSTSEPASSERIVNDLAERGASLVDAPLARTPAEAEAGRLNTMVGAAPDDLARVRPLLEACCENIFHMGPVGSGHKTKLVYNFITMGYAALISEALCACAATGVDLQRFSEVVSAGGANSGIFQLIVPKAIERGDCSGLAFNLARLRLLVFGLGAGLAGFAGVVLTPIWGLRPHVGIDAVIPAFLIIVLGGVGSFWGAVIGGILVGLAVGITGAYASEWSLLSMYLLLIAVVTIRARGLLGKKSALEA